MKQKLQEEQQKRQKADVKKKKQYDQIKGEYQRDRLPAIEQTKQDEKAEKDQ